MYYLCDVRMIRSRLRNALILREIGDEKFLYCCVICVVVHMRPVHFSTIFPLGLIISKYHLQTSKIYTISSIAITYIAIC